MNQADISPTVNYKFKTRLKTEWLHIIVMLLLAQQNFLKFTLKFSVFILLKNIKQQHRLFGVKLHVTCGYFMIQHAKNQITQITQIHS